MTPGSGQSIESIIQAEANRLGFSLVGFCNLNPKTYNLFIEWVALGHHASMTYLSRADTLAKRQSSDTLVPGMKSAIVLGLPHDKPVAPTSPGNSGNVAAYAWGKDYHLVFPALHAQLMTAVRHQANRTFRWQGFSDSAPILERDFGVRAGLGWIGKNSMLISPRFGSTFLLSEIFTDLELIPSIPFSGSHCGTCHNCLDACPTGCIQSNCTLDANRCLSYLTIEHKGDFATVQGALIQDWAFGCDVCQQVCPWNIRFAPEHGSAHLNQSTRMKTLQLAEIESLSVIEFKEKFDGSPLLRAKQAGIIRNLQALAKNKQR